jgi:predicted metal-binding protein
MKRIAILNCSNVTGELNCPSFHCLEALEERKGMFAFYESANQAPRLVGIISCAGCPTLVAPEKLFRRIRPLAAAGVEVIHLSTCLMVLCPFRKRYLELLKTKYPDISFVEGTHDGPEGIKPELFVEGMKSNMSRMIIQPQKSMADMIAFQRS